MEQRTYFDFDLLVESAGEAGYRARVLGSPAGETRPVTVEVPFSELQVENFLLRIGRPRRSTVRGVRSPEAALVREFGGQLFDAVFRDQLRVALATSLNHARSQEAGLRVRLRLSECPELADLPWEYLYDGQARRFLALSEWTPVVRYLDLPGLIRPLAVRPPLRILVLAASPADFDTLDVDAEWANLTEALGDLQRAGQVHIERVAGGSLAQLQRTLRRGQFHVLHYIGHGGYDSNAEDGVLALEGPTGRAQMVTGTDLGTLLHDHRSLRLVVLNSCEGARTGRTDPYSGTAQSLLYQEIPAVVAMQFDITDHAAIVFSHNLYEALADGYPLDAATAEARKAVDCQPNPIEWATPVLYLRASDARIFDITERDTTQREPTRTPHAESEVQPPAATLLRHEKADPPSSPPVDKPPVTQQPDETAEPNPHLRHQAEPQLPQQEPSAPENRPAIQPISVGQWVVCLAISPDGTQLAIGTRARVRVCNLDTRAELWRQSHGKFIEDVNGVAFSPDGRRLATGSADKTARIWDAATGTPQFQLRHDKEVWAVAFSPDGRRLATSSADKTARIWDAATGTRQLEVRHDDWVRAVAFSPDGRRLATGSDDKTARIWDAATGTPRLQLRHDKWVWAVAFSPDGRRLATGSADKTARIWDAATGTQQLEVRHGATVKAVAFSPDGRRLTTGSYDKTARTWDTTS